MDNQNIIITGLHLAVTDAIRSRINTKLEKLFNHEWHIQQVRIEIEQTNAPSHADEFSAKGHVEVKGKPIVITETGNDLYHCINILVEKLDRKLRQRAEKIRSNRKHPHAIEIENADIPKAND
ncbi:MAG TPA: ribosome-associated translation inhibitor RaiA [Bacteroidales bacterium]|nr:ribosome-associated translation inhibitor RaiA [Bacteroidales bacterium]